jgi:hypothetical protein
MAASASSVPGSSSAGEHHVGAAVGERRAVLEQPGVVRLHALQLARQPGRERRRVGKAAEAGDAGQARRVVRQPLGLLVGDHLQPMLDRAQEAIGRA